MRAAGFSPSVRLFEAAACGTPIVSDIWPGIETLFTPGKEILLVDNMHQVVQLLAELPEERRRDIAAAARRRLTHDHTPYHRACQLESYYREVIAERRTGTRLEIVA
jgi:spore maturation protein CgeB